MNLVHRHVSFEFRFSVFRFGDGFPTGDAMKVVVSEATFDKGREMEHVIPEGA